MGITDLYRKEETGEDIKLTQPEVDKGLAVAKRILTDEQSGVVLMFEKTKLASGHNMSGMTYASGMDKVEILRSVLKVLDIKQADLPGIMNLLDM